MALHEVVKIYKLEPIFTFDLNEILNLWLLCI